MKQVKIDLRNEVLNQMDAVVWNAIMQTRNLKQKKLKKRLKKNQDNVCRESQQERAKLETSWNITVGKGLQGLAPLQLFAS